MSATTEYGKANEILAENLLDHEVRLVRMEHKLDGLLAIFRAIAMRLEELGGDMLDTSSEHEDRSVPDVDQLRKEKIDAGRWPEGPDSEDEDGPAED